MSLDRCFATSFAIRLALFRCRLLMPGLNSESINSAACMGWEQELVVNFSQLKWVYCLTIGYYSSRVSYNIWHTIRKRMILIISYNQNVCNPIGSARQWKTCCNTSAFWKMENQASELKSCLNVQCCKCQVGLCHTSTFLTPVPLCMIHSVHWTSTPTPAIFSCGYNGPDSIKMQTVQLKCKHTNT